METTASALPPLAPAAGPTVREVQAKGILTTSNLPVCDFSANPYTGCTHGCRYCYASFMKRFTGHDEAWGEFLDVKLWPPIKRPEKYAGKEVFIGSVTDPYLPEEAEHRRTRALLEELRGVSVKLSIQTKSDLVLRDLDLISQFSDARVGFSVNTLDEGFRAAMDRGAPIERRLAAMEAFHDAGVRTTCFVSPIFPGITDVGAIVERVRGICNLVWLENLNLRGAFKADILAWVAEARPDLTPLYDAIYRKGDTSFWQELDSEIAAFAQARGLDYVVNDDTMERSFDAPPAIVNFFYHEKIKKSARKAAENRP